MRAVETFAFGSQVCGTCGYFSQLTWGAGCEARLGGEPAAFCLRARRGFSVPPAAQPSVPSKCSEGCDDPGDGNVPREGGQALEEGG